MQLSELAIGKVVYDIERGIIGTIKAVHEPGGFISPTNNKPVLAPVVEFDSGDSLVASPASVSTWKELDPKYQPFYSDVSKAVTQVVKALCGAAAQLNVPPRMAFLILGRVLQVQGGALLKPADPKEGEGWT